MAKERLTVTQGLCDHIRILLQGGADMKRAGELTGISQATVSRIKAAGYDAEQFKVNNEKRRENEEKKKQTVEKFERELKEGFNHYRAVVSELYDQQTNGIQQVPGQLSMELPKQDSEKDQAAMMRFLAGKNDENKKLIIAYMDALAVKLSAINDTLCQILRAVRRE